MAGILHIGLVFVHETAAVAIDQDPAHHHILAQAVARHPVGQAFEADAERIVAVRVAETIGAVEVPHVPEPGTDLLRHPYAITAVAAHRSAQHRLDLPELPLHGGIA